MEDLELSWQTFEFHTASCMNLEFLLSKYSKIFIDKKKDSAIEQEYEFIYLNKVIKYCNLLSNEYKKQNLSLKDIIKIHKHHSLHGVVVPPEREVSIKYLHDLINTNATLIEQLERKKRTFKLL